MKIEFKKECKDSYTVKANDKDYSVYLEPHNVDDKIDTYIVYVRDFEFCCSIFYSEMVIRQLETNLKIFEILIGEFEIIKSKTPRPQK
jgi:hypothetical protein